VENWIPENRNRLARRRAKKPDTKAGQIWALWPEIKAALDDGQSFKSVCRWLQEDSEVNVTVAELRTYVSRSRRREAVTRRVDADKTFIRAATSEEPRFPADRKRVPLRTQEDTTPVVPSERPDPEDPMAGARRALEKARRFDIRDLHGDGDPTGKNLI
jgi:hypothetical protein